MASATERLGAFVAESGSCDLTSVVLDKAASCFLNAYGLAAQGYEEPVCAAIRRLVAPSPPQVSGVQVWPGSVRVSALDAAMLNGVAVHANFQDDTCYASVTHPASLIIPSAVAAAQECGSSLMQCLRAIAVGYTALGWIGAQGRVARAMIERGFRCSPSLGALGSAAAASAVLQLGAHEAANALGIAAGLSGGTLEPVRSGSEEWRVQNGRACANGLLAALLAGQGVNAAPESLEGPCGQLFTMTGMDHAPPEWLSPPDFRVMLEVVAKPWATLGDNMPAAMAAKLVHDEGRGTEAIARITVRIWRTFVDFPGTAYKGPFNSTTQALASMLFAVAAMLVHGDLDYSRSSEGREHPEVLRLISLICIEPDDDGDALSASIRVSYKDGSIVAKEADEAPQNQLFHDRKTSCSLLESRLRRYGFDTGQGSAFAERVYAELDEQSGLTVSGLFESLQLPLGSRVSVRSRKAYRT